MRTLAEHALEQTSLISNDAIKSIESIIAALDAKLTAQVNLIMHHADFQQLEAPGAACTTWSTTPRPTSN